jgi:hypothetical protein
VIGSVGHLNAARMPSWTPRAPARNTAQQSTRTEATRTESARIEATSRRAGDLQVVTDDGDTINISFRTLERLKAVTNGTDTSMRADSRLKMNISISGSLDDEEIADLGQLLTQLGSAGASLAPTVPNSLQSYNYSYRQDDALKYSFSVTG